LAMPFEPPHPRQMDESNEPSPPQGFPLARDRIAQVYLGLSGTLETQEKARRRIHWLAGQAKGLRVLDIGCSQGILPILLAREGFHVTGLDVDAEALEYAREILARENEFVRQRVTLVHADLETAHLEPASFDTVILGEVIEHLIRPDILLRNAFSLLKPGGSFLLTTPFGFHPSPDHRRIVSLSSLVERVKPYCRPVHLSVVDNYIRFAGVKTDPAPEDWASHDETVLLPMAEQAVVAQQRLLHDEIQRWKSSEQRVRERVKSLERDLAASNRKQETLTAETHGLRAHGEDLQARLKDSQRQLEQTSQALQNVQRQHEALQHDLRALENERDELAAALARATAQNQDLHAQRNAFEQGVARLKAENQRSDRALKTLQDEFDALTGRHSILQSQFESQQQARRRSDRALKTLQDEFDALTGRHSILQSQFESQQQARRRAASNYLRTRSKLDAVVNSFSYRMGWILTQAVARPGRNTLALPYRLGRLFIDRFQKAFENPETQNRESTNPSSSGGVFRAEKPVSKPYVPIPGRSLYLLHSSLPWISNGYGTRSHGLLSAMKAAGMDVWGVTRLGFPVDFSKLHLDRAPERDQVDGVTYLRLPTSRYPYLKTPLELYLRKYQEAVLALAGTYKPALLHAASNYVNGLVAVRAAEVLGIPSLYETRGLWEITRLSREPEWEFSDEYTQSVRLETEACRRASAVIAITGALKEYLVRERGIPADKIMVAPNGVDASRFTPRPRDPQLETEFHLQGAAVIGFVGSFTEYEGLDQLLEAAAILNSRRHDFRLLLVGDGACYEDLQRRSREIGLSDTVHFTGRVPHDRVEAYYSLIDIAPFPRRSPLVCELVSPLKPFEAMAMEKTVVASDVAALAEIIRDGETGLLHRRDDPEDLARVLERLLDHPDLRRRLAEAGRTWVQAERQWNHSALRVRELYEHVIKTHTRSGPDRL